MPCPCFPLRLQSRLSPEPARLAWAAGHQRARVPGHVTTKVHAHTLLHLTLRPPRAFFALTHLARRKGEGVL